MKTRDRRNKELEEHDRRSQHCALLILWLTYGMLFSQLPRAVKRCPRCKETDAVYFQSQQRASDTGMVGLSVAVSPFKANFHHRSSTMFALRAVRSTRRFERGDQVLLVCCHKNNGGNEWPDRLHGVAFSRDWPSHGVNGLLNVCIENVKSLKMNKQS